MRQRRVPETRMRRGRRVPMFSVTLLFASVRLPAALPMAQVTLLALVLPSDHW